jgi:hypothetical protein
MLSALTRSGFVALASALAEAIGSVDRSVARAVRSPAGRVYADAPP